MSKTGFYWHERCFWHDQGAIGVFSAPGEFLQPQAASESPESKRRLKNILEVSGLIDELHVVKPPAATMEDLRRFHTPRYLDELQAGDKARGGNGGDCAPYMPGSWAAATHSAGLAIAAVAGLAYVAVWEAYLAMTHYSFMEVYVAQALAAKRAAGVTGEAYARFAAQMETMRVQYANPLYRLPMTFAEIFPVGVVIALISAALVRNPKFLPARSRPTG